MKTGYKGGQQSIFRYLHQALALIIIFTRGQKLFEISGIICYPTGYIKQTVVEIRESASCLLQAAAISSY